MTLPSPGPVDDKPLPPAADDLARVLRAADVPAVMVGSLLREISHWARREYGWQCGLDNPCDCGCTCCRRRHGIHD